MMQRGFPPPPSFDKLLAMESDKFTFCILMVVPFRLLACNESSRVQNLMVEIAILCHFLSIWDSDVYWIRKIAVVHSQLWNLNWFDLPSEIIKIRDHCHIFESVRNTSVCLPLSNYQSISLGVLNLRQLYFFVIMPSFPSKNLFSLSF